MPLKIGSNVDGVTGEVYINNTKVANITADGWIFLKGSSSNWTVMSANATLNIGDSVLANTIGGPLTLTLPASPTGNKTIAIADYSGNFGNNALTLARNGNMIMGLAEDLICSTSWDDFVLTYVDSTIGWRMI